MNIAKSILNFALLACCVLFTGCNSDDDSPLTFYGDEYSVRVGVNEGIPFTGGTNDLSVKVANPYLLEASISKLKGLVVTGKAVGRTSIAVSDNGVTPPVNKTLKVNVVPMNLAFVVTDNQSGISIFNAGNGIFLAKEGSNYNFYVVERNSSLDKIHAKGTYSFSVESGRPYITMNFLDKGQSMSVKFSLDSTPLGLLSILQRYLDPETLKDFKNDNASSDGQYLMMSDVTASSKYIRAAFSPVYVLPPSVFGI